MRSRISAGLVMYRWKNGQLEVFLAHPGGPFFKSKDEGHWTIPKGEVDEGESLLATARREFQEEVGIEPRGEFVALGSITQKGGKIVHAWAFEGNCEEPHLFQCNTFRMEWPPHSGKFVDVPEVDRAEFFPLDQARKKIKETQRPLLDRLEVALKERPQASHQH